MQYTNVIICGGFFINSKQCKNDLYLRLYCIGAQFATTFWSIILISIQCMSLLFVSNFMSKISHPKTKFPTSHLCKNKRTFSAGRRNTLAQRQSYNCFISPQFKNNCNSIRVGLALDKSNRNFLVTSAGIGVLSVISP